MAKYGTVEYWNERYTDDTEPFEWYQNFEGLKQYLKPFLVAKHNPKVLHVGCGNSKLSEDLYQFGIRDIVNIDISAVVIARMQNVYSRKPELKFWTVDVTSMNIPSVSMDIVIDKGLFDSLLCGDGALKMVSKMLLEVARVLRPGGVFLLLSHGEFDNRAVYLKNSDLAWELEECINIPKPDLADLDKTTEGYFLYVCRKFADS